MTDIIYYRPKDRAADDIRIYPPQRGIDHWQLRISGTQINLTHEQLRTLTGLSSWALTDNSLATRADKKEQQEAAE